MPDMRVDRGKRVVEENDVAVFVCSTCDTYALPLASR